MGELRRLCYQTKEKAYFKTFKWVLKGRWNQGTGNSGSTRTYQQWDELGISYVGSDGVKYGPSYWTVDSFSSSGTPWAGDLRGPADLFDGEWGSETSKCDYSGIADADGYVEIIIHTTSGEAIIPNGVGLISCNNQSSYASSTPAHFILYGLDESTNEYVQLIDVGAASVNKGNTQTTTVSFEPVEVVSGTYYLLAPSDLARGTGLRFEMPPPDEVKIGNQIWKNVNLSVDDGQGGIITKTVNYGQGNVVEYYYTWDAAARVASSIEGWHLPTTTEWDALATAVGGSSTAGTKLKSTYGWSSGNGDGSYGFAAFPAGTYLNSFGNFGTAAYFWTADQISANYGYNRYFSTGASMNSNTTLTKSWKLSVRLIKDV